MNAQSPPCPGSYYRSKRHDTLISIALEAYGEEALRVPLDCLRRINNCEQNQDLRGNPTRLFPAGQLNLFPRTIQATRDPAGSSLQYPVLWIPVPNDSASTRLTGTVPATKAQIDTAKKGRSPESPPVQELTWEQLHLGVDLPTQRRVEIQLQREYIPVLIVAPDSHNGCGKCHEDSAVNAGLYLHHTRSSQGTSRASLRPMHTSVAAQVAPLHRLYPNIQVGQTSHPYFKTPLHIVQCMHKRSRPEFAGELESAIQANLSRYRSSNRRCNRVILVDHQLTQTPVHTTQSAHTTQSLLLDIKWHEAPCTSQTPASELQLRWAAFCGAWPFSDMRSTISRLQIDVEHELDRQVAAAGQR